jgi:DsbC/DsbD-like thiol-disulfide interchange protein
MSFSRAIVFVLLVFLALPPVAAQGEMRAAAFRPFKEVQLRLLGMRDAQGQFTGALDMRLAEGFKTYWKNAGDSGVPPQFDFSSSEGVSAITSRLPLPHSFDDGAGGKAFGYKQDVMFVLAGKAEPGAILRLKLDFAVCGTLCIPLSAELALDLARDGMAESDAVARLAATRAALPQPLGVEGVSIKRTGEHAFTLRLPYPGDVRTLEVFPDAPAFFEVKGISATEPGVVSVQLLAQPAPGKPRLGPLSLTYGTREISFERLVDVDAAQP